MALPNQNGTPGESLAAPPVAGYPEVVGAAALIGSEAVLIDSNGEPVGIEDLLPPERLTYTEAVVTSMSETLGLNRDDIRFVLDNTTERGGRIVAIDASPNGQYIGIYQHILDRRQADPSWYTIQVANQRVDPLAGCTRSAYEAMIADARARGVAFLPDSLALNQHNSHVWTATMMTGEPLESPGKIWIGSSSSYNKVNFVGQAINRGGKSFRVRPAVVVGQLEA